MTTAEKLRELAELNTSDSKLPHLQAYVRGRRDENARLKSAISAAADFIEDACCATERWEIEQAKAKLDEVLNFEANDFSDLEIFIKPKTIRRKYMKLENRLKVSDDQTPRYWVSGEGSDEFDKIFFDSNEKFFQFLQDNDPIECGCDWMTDKEYAKNVTEAE